jgi:hypothetical protein
MGYAPGRMDAILTEEPSQDKWPLADNKPPMAPNLVPCTRRWLLAGYWRFPKIQ